MDRWKRLEDDRVTEEAERERCAEETAANALCNAQRAQTLSYLESVAKRNQIFNMNEAFHMLSKELSEMMQRQVSLLHFLHAQRVSETKLKQWLGNTIA